MDLFDVQANWAKTSEQERASYHRSKTERFVSRLNEESWLSVLFGIPAIVIALATIVLFLLFWGGRPIGPREFYIVEKNLIASSNGLASTELAWTGTIRVVPSLQLPVILYGVLFLTGLVTLISRAVWPTRKVTTAAAGAIACGVALSFGWLLIVMEELR